MSERKGYFEIVRTDAEQPWHVRFRGRNGHTVMVSENYVRREAALRAIASMARFFSPTGQVWISTVRVGNESYADIRYGSEDRQTWTEAHRIQIREVDQR